MNTLHFSLDEMEVDSRPETVGIYWNNILTSQSRRTGVCVCLHVCFFGTVSGVCEGDRKVRWHSLEFLSTSIVTLASAHFFIYLRIYSAVCQP